MQVNIKSPTHTTASPASDALKVSLAPSPKNWQAHTTASPASDALKVSSAPSPKNWQAEVLLRKHRQPLSVGCWNVCSMKCLTTQSFIAGELLRYNIDIMCVSETRINGIVEGSEIRTPEDDASFSFFNSGSLDGSAYGGVGIVLSPLSAKSLLE